MKLSEKQIELMAQEIAIEATHFEIFDKSVFKKNIGLNFEQRLKMFYSIYHRCNSYKKG
tara:strand:+ start:259 stop:435 length:177 start_codon:yes stop_codon:yes gene_type:complete